MVLDLIDIRYSAQVFSLNALYLLWIHRPELNERYIVSVTYRSANQLQAHPLL